MIRVRLSQIHNKPYYEITKGKARYGAFGVNQAIKIIKKKKKNEEKVKLESIDQILDGHNKLLELLK